LDDATNRLYFNQTGQNYVAWNWLAGGSAVSNTDGDITSSVSANTEAGFSIVGFTGNGSAGSTVGHGLNSAPEMIMLKERNVSGDSWVVYHNNLGDAGYLILNGTIAAATSATLWGDGTSGVRPTSSVFTIGANSSINQSGSTFISYCFHSVDGYSKVGSYTGNGSTDGTFVYTGFRPAWVLVKVTNIANRWVLFDSARSPTNPVEEGQELNPDDASAEGTSGTDCFDFLSNGFKLRRTGDVFNTSGYNYIYLAFAEQPFKYSNAR
jgi:hypothetical protein